MNIVERPFYGPTDWDYVKRLTGVLRVEDTCGLVFVDSDTNEIVAAGIVDNILRKSANISIAITKTMALKHGIAQRFLEYVFIDLDREYLCSFVGETNIKALRLNKKLGLKEFARYPEDYEAGADLILMRLARSDYFKRT